MLGGGFRSGGGGGWVGQGGCERRIEIQKKNFLGGGRVYVGGGGSAGGSGWWGGVRVAVNEELKFL